DQPGRHCARSGQDHDRHGGRGRVRGRLARDRAAALPARMSQDVRRMRGRVAIVGAAEADEHGKLPHKSAFQLHAEAARNALAAARHMHEFGTTSEQLAEVAVATRRWAQLNPRALMRDPLTVEDVLASRLISWPLHLLDCCLVTDAGGAVVVTSAERARDCAKRPVYVLGAGEASTHVMVTLVEAVHQLRGECGPRQVAGATLALCHGLGGMFSAAATLIASTEVP